MKLPNTLLYKVISPENLLMLSGIIAAFHLGKVAPAIPILQDSLNLSVIEAGFLISLMQFSGATFGLIMGIFSEKIGAEKSIIIGQAILLVSSLLAAFVNHPFQLLILRAFESLGFLMVVLPTPSLIRILVPSEKLSFRLGLWSCYMAIGTASAFILGPYLIDIIGWKGWFFIPAVLSGLCILLLIKILFKALESKGKVQQHIKVLWRKQLNSILRHKSTWYVGLAFAMYTGPWIAVIGFLPTIYNQAGINNIFAGILTAFASLVNIFGNVLAAILIHKGIQAKKLLFIGYFTMLVTAFVSFSSIYSSIGIKYIAILLFSSVGGLIPAILFILSVKSAPNNETIATAVGFVQQFSSLGMLLIPPFIAKVAYVSGGWNFTWIITGLAAMIGLLLATHVARQYQ